MQLPPILRGESRARLTQGAVVGSLLTMAIGFGFAGWQLTGNVERHTTTSVNEAVVATLTLICVDRFKQAADVKATRVALNATDSWKRDSFVEKGGWATFPGDAKPNYEVAEACARVLSDTK